MEFSHRLKCASRLEGEILARIDSISPVRVLLATTKHEFDAWNGFLKWVEAYLCL
ncbi:hypothetical protein AMTR_s00019p00247000 [Amborella trichopoda]|uniref:Uncharacterized protein n=1 Tax=Amborella trichopoda TaxID=13333 RepID=W1PBX3_AMBTC|nr:hypothetical protein AMTR_s00019p00247000 [Amborella trichopoda]